MSYQNSEKGNSYVRVVRGDSAENIDLELNLKIFKRRGVQKGENGDRYYQVLSIPLMI